MRRIIIMIFAVIATMLSFNQKANAQKQVKVPVFEGIVSAKKGNVNIRKEASAQSEKIGTLYANISFYPIISQTEDWYCILIPYYFLDMDNPDLDITDGRVTCGYVSKAFCKNIGINENTRRLSNFVYYLEKNIGCENSIRKSGDYKQNIIVSGTFALYINEEGRCMGRDEGRFIGVPHKGIMVGEYINKMDAIMYTLEHNWDLQKIDEIYGEMSSDFYNPSAPAEQTLTDEQIAKSMNFAHKAIMYAVPNYYDEENNYNISDNKGVKIMYVDMDKYPFKYETIQFNDDESFSYFVVDNEEYIGIEDSVLVQKCITDLFYTLKYNMWEGKEYRFTDPFGSFLGEIDLSLEELIEAYDKKYRSGKKLDFRTLSDLKIDKKKEADGYSYSVRAKSVRDSDKHEYIIMIDITPEKKINSFELTKLTDL